MNDEDRLQQLTAELDAIRADLRAKQDEINAVRIRLGHLNAKTGDAAKQKRIAAFYAKRIDNKLKRVRAAELCIIDGLTMDQAAQQLGIPKSRSNEFVNRGVKHLLFFQSSRNAGQLESDHDVHNQRARREHKQWWANLIASYRASLNVSAQP